jgi:hypothetical protein
VSSASNSDCLLGVRPILIDLSRTRRLQDDDDNTVDVARRGLGELSRLRRDLSV